MVALACNRYEVRSPDCPPDPPSPSRSAIAWLRTGKTGTISGTVLNNDLRPLHGATVTVKPGRGGAYADSTGAFTIESLQAGHYQLLIRRIGYGAASDSVQLSTESGIVLRVVMMPQTLELDGCGYVQVRVRKPWWKWW
jgi:hypothetical protein